MVDLLEKFVVETYRLFIEISPYLILGFFFAGLLHTLLGEKYIKKHFARSGFWPTIKAAIFGIPLPVCSCAVIPLAESLRRDGASKSSTMAFLVSTPSSGVDSILATYALMGPVFAVFRPIASLVSGVLVGIVTHFKGGEKDGLAKSTETANNNNSNNKKSIKEVFTYGFKVIPSELSKWLVIGVVIGGAISALVPADFGVKYLMGSPLLNYVVILLISVPLYICATGSIPIAAALITKGVLPGAALALLVAGPATNSVTISFVYKKLGKKVAFFYVLSIVIVSVATGLVFDALVPVSASDMTFVTAGKGAHLPEYFKITCAVLMVYIFLNSKFDFGITKLFRRKTPMEGKNMHTVKVPDMTCQHCKMKITKTIESMPEVQLVSIDLDNKEVAFETASDRQTVVDRIKAEGYNPV
jgi:uncharacterized membrane protein YraQ (UPF0718 family)/copper chaperone CopZ